MDRSPGAETASMMRQSVRRTPSVEGPLIKGPKINEIRIGNASVITGEKKDDENKEMSKSINPGDSCSVRTS